VRESKPFVWPVFVTAEILLAGIFETVSTAGLPARNTKENVTFLARAVLFLSSGKLE
jgi:hypothetical protein